MVRTGDLMPTVHTEPDQGIPSWYLPTEHEGEIQLSDDLSRRLLQWFLAGLQNCYLLLLPTIRVA